MSTRHITIALLATSVVLSILATRYIAANPQPAPAVLRARALELVDESGRVRCRINTESTGEVVLRLIDQRGTIRVKLGAGTDGSGMVLLDETTEPGIHLVARRTATREKKATSVTVTGAGGRQRVIAP